MLANGKEVDRLVGLASYERLVQMCQRPAANMRDGLTSGPLDPRSLVRWTVRIRVDDPQGQSYGTGTIVDVRGGEALVLTCGHLFRESQGKGQIQVELFHQGAPRGIPGRLIGYDLERDLGLLAIRPGVPITAARIADASRIPQQGQQVIALGCPNGQVPQARPARVTAVDRYQGPPNIEVAGMPVEGCSGGGLFNQAGDLIGVCFAADASENAGLYSGLASIHAELDRLGLQAVYASNEPPSSAADQALVPIESQSLLGEVHIASGQKPTASWPAAATLTPVAIPRDSAPVEERAATAQLTAAEQGALCEIRKRSRAAEVICIIRPADPKAASEIIVLEDVSPQFLQQLTDTGRRASHQLTSLDVPTHRTDDARMKNDERMMKSE
jgi:hypothetical protein